MGNNQPKVDPKGKQLAEYLNPFDIRGDEKQQAYDRESRA